MYMQAQTSPKTFPVRKGHSVGAQKNKMWNEPFLKQPLIKPTLLLPSICYNFKNVQQRVLRSSPKRHLKSTPTLPYSLTGKGCFNLQPTISSSRLKSTRQMLQFRVGGKMEFNRFRGFMNYQLAVRQLAQLASCNHFYFLKYSSDQICSWSCKNKYGTWKRNTVQISVFQPNAVVPQAYPCCTTLQAVSVEPGTWK